MSTDTWYDVYSPDFRSTTHETYARMRENDPGLRLAISAEDLYWRPIPLFRSLAELPVAWDV